MDNLYASTIEDVLRQIAELERRIASVPCDVRKKSLQKNLKNKEKRLDHMIPYQHKRALDILCKNNKIQGKFT